MKHRIIRFFSGLSCVLIFLCVAVTSAICGGAHADNVENARPAMAKVVDVTPPSEPAAPFLTDAQMRLLCRLISAECVGEPFECRVAVAAVVYNRMRLEPGTGSVTDAIFDPEAFESVARGDVGRDTDASDLAVSRLAASLAAERDPTDGALRCAKTGTPAAADIHVTYTVGGMVFGR